VTGERRDRQQEDVPAFRARRETVGDYATTEDVHAGVARRLVTEGLDRALEVGCGEGKLGYLLDGTGVRWVGVDLTPGLLERAPLPKVRGDAAALPFRENAFAAVAALYMLYRLQKPRGAVEEAYRVLRPGGLFAACAPSRFDAPELVDLLPQARSTFDAEIAPELIGSVFGAVEVDAWDGRYVRLPDQEALRRYLASYGLTEEEAAVAAERHKDRVPLVLTKRGAVVYARKP